jgi:hypothetical protein
MLSSVPPSALPVMERAWLIASSLCLIAAALFLWRALSDEAYMNGAFVAATLGVVAWFLRVRTQLRKTIPPLEDSPADEDEEDSENLDED